MRKQKVLRSRLHPTGNMEKQVDGSSFLHDNHSHPTCLAMC